MKLKEVHLKIKEVAKKRILFLPHAVRQMSRPDRMITPNDVKLVIEEGKIIEDYPDDPRGHSCLISGKDINNRSIHVVCAPKDDYLAIITAYLPDPNLWYKDFTKRRT